MRGISPELRSLHRAQPPGGRVGDGTVAVAWSSCRAYTSGAADPLLAENSYYLEWGVDDGSRQRRWREFLMQEDQKEQPIRHSDWVVGDETFQSGCRVIRAEPCNGGAVGHPSPEGRWLAFRRNLFVLKD